MGLPIGSKMRSARPGLFLQRGLPHLPPKPRTRACEEAAARLTASSKTHLFDPAQATKVARRGCVQQHAQQLLTGALGCVIDRILCYEIDQVIKIHLGSRFGAPSASFFCSRSPRSCSVRSASWLITSPKLSAQENARSKAPSFPSCFRRGTGLRAT